MFPELWFSEAPVTVAKQFTSFLTRNTPKKPKINASLKSINFSSGKNKVAKQSVFNKDIKNRFLAPPPVTKIC